CFVVFFFQAEDGIRDPLVTGVQTCALPIYGGTDRGVNEYGCGVGSCGYAGDIYGECERRGLPGGVAAWSWGDGQPWLGWRACCPCQYVPTCILQVDGLRCGVIAGSCSKCQEVCAERHVGRGNGDRNDYY